MCIKVGWWNNCIPWCTVEQTSKIISLLGHLSKVQTWVFTTLSSFTLLPDATCQFEHRPIKQQLQVCTKCDIDVFFRKCWSLNHTYSNRWSMWYGLVPSSMRERKQTSHYRKSSIVAILIFKTSKMLLPGCWFDPPLEPLVRRHLWGYCMCNAINTVDNLYQGL